MKTLKYLAAAGLLAAAAAAVAAEGSPVISEQAGAKNSTVTADVAVQAPAPAVKQKTALSPEEWQRVLAAMPKAEVMNGFAVHSKQFCASCHGKEGIADTPNWPDVAGQPYAVTVKALLDYRDGRRKGTPASDLMSAAAPSSPISRLPTWRRFTNTFRDATPRKRRRPHPHRNLSIRATPRATSPRALLVTALMPAATTTDWCRCSTVSKRLYLPPHSRTTARVPDTPTCSEKCASSVASSRTPKSSSWPTGTPLSRDASVRKKRREKGSRNRSKERT